MSAVTVVRPSDGASDPSRLSLGVQRAAKKPLTMDPIGDINQPRRSRWSLTRTKSPRRSLPSAQNERPACFSVFKGFAKKPLISAIVVVCSLPPARTRPTPATPRPSKVCPSDGPSDPSRRSLGVQRPAKKPLTMDPIGDINQPRRLSAVVTHAYQTPSSVTAECSITSDQRVSRRSKVRRKSH